VQTLDDNNKAFAVVKVNLKANRYGFTMAITPLVLIAMSYCVL
jgi:spore maturation protein SpmA